MKKKILCYIAALSFVTIGIIGTDVFSNQISLGNFISENIEALADNETVTYTGYYRQNLGCSVCGADVPGCIWCSVDDNCSCTVPVHHCTK